MYTVYLELVQVLSAIFGDSCKAEFSITICKLQNYGVIIVIHIQRLTAKENVFLDIKNQMSIYIGKF
jgi:hypothetical protein